MGDKEGDLGNWRKRSRRKWSDAQRREIVAASYTPGVSMAGVARDYGINANLLWNWRRKFRQRGVLLARDCDPVISFASVELVESDRPAGVAGVGAMELSLPNGMQIRVDANVDERALVRVLSAAKAAG